jgi:hypothetical protein
MEKKNSKRISFLLAGGIIAMLSILVLSSCSKKEAKKMPGPEVKTSNEAFLLLDDLRKAYVEKDDARMKALSTEAGYTELKKEIKPFDSAELKFTPRWVEIKADTITVNVSWEGLWRYQGKETSERGMAVFELKDMKFNSVVKGSPFLHP